MTEFDEENAKPAKYSTKLLNDKTVLEGYIKTEQ